jgi:hypothetical protein
MKTILTAALLILISQPIWACEADECPILYRCSASVQSLHMFIHGPDHDKTPINPWKGTSEIHRSLHAAIFESFKKATKGSLFMCDLDEKISDDDAKIKMSASWESDAKCSYTCTETDL